MVPWRVMVASMAPGPDVDAAHDLDLVLGDDGLGRLGPVAFAMDEEGRPPGVAVGGLDDEVVAQAGALGGGHQLGVRPDAGQRVGHRWHAGLGGQAGGHGLGVDVLAQRGRRMGDAQAELGRQALGLLVEHDEDRQATLALRAHEVADFLVPQQVVVDLLDRRELAPRPLLRHEDARVAALEAVVVADVEEVAHPAIDAQQVEGRRRDEVDGRAVGAQEGADLGDAAQHRARRCRPSRPLARSRDSVALAGPCALSWARFESRSPWSVPCCAGGDASCPRSLTRRAGWSAPWWTIRARRSTARAARRRRRRWPRWSRRPPSTSPSVPRRPSTCSATGRPSSPKPMGTRRPGSRTGWRRTGRAPNPSRPDRPPLADPRRERGAVREGLEPECRGQQHVGAGPGEEVEVGGMDAFALELRLDVGLGADRSRRRR